MGLTVFGPGDEWPAHAKPWWRKTLKHARGAGWTLHYLNASHLFGVAKCPAGQHAFKVDCTAKAGESFAIDADKAIRDCPHGAGGTGSKVAERTFDAETLLATAERCIQLVERQLVQAEAHHHAMQELDRLALLLDTADANLKAVTDGHASGDGGEGSLGVQDAALERAIELEGAPAPPEIGATLDEAENAVDRAAGVVDSIRREGLATPLRARAGKARGDIATLRARLVDLEQHIGHENQ